MTLLILAKLLIGSCVFRVRSIVSLNFGDNNLPRPICYRAMICPKWSFVLEIWPIVLLNFGDKNEHWSIFYCAKIYPNYTPKLLQSRYLNSNKWVIWTNQNQLQHHNHLQRAHDRHAMDTHWVPSKRKKPSCCCI